MKKTIIIILACCAINFGMAQTEFGVKAGANYSNTVPEEYFSFEEYNYVFGFYAGGFVNFSVSDNFSIQPELLFETFGTKRNINLEHNGYGADSFEDLKFMSISLPVALQYDFSGLYIEAGAQVFYTFSDKWMDIQDNGTVYYRHEYGKGFNYGLLAGAGYSFRKVGINARYQTKFLENDTSSNVFGLGISYTF